MRFYNGRGTAEQWIKEGKYALNWTRLSCHRFVANRVRLSLFVLAYNLGNFLRRLCLPKAVRHWSLRSVQVKLIKMGGRLVRALPSIDLSVVRGVGSSTVVSGSVGSYRPVIAGTKLMAGMQSRSCQEGERSRESACLQCAFTPLAGARRRQRWTRSMVHSKKRIPYWIDRRMNGLAGPDIMPSSRLDCPLSMKTPNMGNTR